MAATLVVPQDMRMSRTLLSWMLTQQTSRCVNHTCPPHVDHHEQASSEQISQQSKHSPVTILMPRDVPAWILQLHGGVQQVSVVLWGWPSYAVPWPAQLHHRTSHQPGPPSLHEQACRHQA